MAMENPTSASSNPAGIVLATNRRPKPPVSGDGLFWHVWLLFGEGRLFIALEMMLMQGFTRQCQFMLFLCVALAHKFSVSSEDLL